MTKLTHLMELIITLQYKELTTAAELAQILNVNKKTVYRYIDTLVEANIPVLTKKGRYGGFYLDSSFFMKQPKLEKEEMEALLMAADLLSNGSGFTFERQLRNAVSKIKNVSVKDNGKFEDMKEESGFDIKRIGNLESIEDTMTKINNAMNKSRVLEINYYSINKNSSSKFKFEPYTILYRGGEWHLIGYSDAKETITVLGLSRVKKVRVLDEIFVKPSKFSVGDYMDELWEKVRGNRNRVRIKFSSGAAEFVKEVKWHSSQEIEILTDGQLIFEVYLDEFSEFKKWILGFGADAEVLEPSNLRSEIAEEIEAIYNSYKKSAV
jgi:predicted DNA-binding transcriptional regulator YafY